MNIFQNIISIAAFKDTLRMSAIQKTMIRKGKKTWRKTERKKLSKMWNNQKNKTTMRRLHFNKSGEETKDELTKDTRGLINNLRRSTIKANLKTNNRLNRC